MENNKEMIFKKIFLGLLFFCFFVSLRGSEDTERILVNRIEKIFESEHLYGYGVSIALADDEGYVLGGYTRTDEEVGPTVLKLDKEGNILWSRLINEISNMGPQVYVRKTLDGYFVASETDRPMNNYHGEIDIVISKLDFNGNILWSRCWGGSEDDRLGDMIVTLDGGCAFIGSSSSTDGDKHWQVGGIDAWIVRLDSMGNKVFQKTYGGTEKDYGKGIIQNYDSTFTIVGTTNSDDGDINGNKGGYDFFLMRLTHEKGDTIWSHSYGGEAKEGMVSYLNRTDDGGFVFAGESSSENFGDGNKGQSDIAVVKTDQNGVLQWDRTFGSSDYDGGILAFPINENEYYLTAYSHTEYADGDIEEGFRYGAGIHMLLDSAGGIKHQFADGSDLFQYSREVIPVGVNEYVAVGAIKYDIISGAGKSIRMTNFCFGHKTSIFDTICQGSEYVLNETSYTSTGIYYDTLLCKTSCDSVLALHLTVLDRPLTQLNRSV